MQGHTPVLKSKKVNLSTLSEKNGYAEVVITLHNRFLFCTLIVNYLTNDRYIIAPVLYDVLSCPSICFSIVVSPAPYVS